MVDRLLEKYGTSLYYVGSFKMDDVKVAQSVGSQFPCAYCDLKFLKENMVLYHMRKAHNDRLPFQCDRCDLKFFKLDSINTHYELSHKIYRKLQCVVCNGRYTRINAHCKKSHGIEFPSTGLVQDLELGKTVETFLKHQANGFSDIKVNEQKLETKNLLDSIRSKYAKLRSTRYECLICGRTFSNKGYLSEHRQRHRGLYKPWECKICGKKFSSGKNQLLSHMAQHSGEKPFSCNYCGKSYLHYVNLRNHIQGAHYKKTRDCRLCGKPFEYKTFWLHFQQEHKGNAKLKYEEAADCDFCGKKLKNSHTLNVHKKYHCKFYIKPATWDNSKTCGECGKLFINKYNLDRHQKQDSGQDSKKEWPCKLCIRVFPRLACLRHHQHQHNVAAGKINKKRARCRFCHKQFSRYQFLISSHSCKGRLEHDRKVASSRLQASLSSMVPDDAWNEADTEANSSTAVLRLSCPNNEGSSRNDLCSTSDVSPSTTISSAYEDNEDCSDSPQNVLSNGATRGRKVVILNPEDASSMIDDKGEVGSTLV